MFILEMSKLSPRDINYVFKFKTDKYLKNKNNCLLKLSSRFRCVYGKLSVKLFLPHKISWPRGTMLFK